MLTSACSDSGMTPQEHVRLLASVTRRGMSIFRVLPWKQIWPATSTVLSTRGFWEGPRGDQRAWQCEQGRGPDGQADQPRASTLSLSQGQAEACAVDRGLQQAPGGSWETVPKIQQWNWAPRLCVEDWGGWGCCWRARAQGSEVGELCSGRGLSSSRGLAPTLCPNLPPGTTLGLK